MTDYPSYLLDEPPAAPQPPQPKRGGWFRRSLVGEPPALAQPQQRGWFRRNLWGLLTVVPLACAMLVVYLDRANAYEKYWTFQPRVPVAAIDGWAQFAGAKIRLAELAEAKDLRDSSGKAFQPPPGLLVWRAVLEFEVADQKTVGGCQIALEDQQGRLFSARPDELSGARIPFPGCTAQDETLNRYQTFAFFITPGDARPVAVRVNRGSNLPRYARIATTG